MSEQDIRAKFDWALRQGDVLADWCNLAEGALRDLMTAYERRIRTDCTAEDLRMKPWRCYEFVQAENVLEKKPIAVIEVSAPQPSQSCPDCGKQTATDLVHTCSPQAPEVTDEQIADAMESAFSETRHWPKSDVEIVRAFLKYHARAILQAKGEHK